MMPLALHLNVPRGTNFWGFKQDPQRNVPQVFTKWSKKKYITWQEALNHARWDKCNRLMAN